MQRILVGVGEYAVHQGTDAVIRTMALGSCVGVMIVVPQQNVSGLLHVALPDSALSPGKAASLPGYFADTGIKAFIGALKRFGVINGGNAVVKIAGGASVMDPQNLFNIGKRNILSVKKNLWLHGLAPRTEAVGG
jgi:chemotaxis protein CheD